MSLLAVMTGLIFARFSRPRARFVFAQKAIVTMHDRRPTLMIRVANARHNTLSNASAALWLIRAEQTAEGQHLRRYYQLELLRQENPVFALTWTIFHVIDQTSPLFGLTAGLIACYMGTSVGGGPAGVGNAVNETVVFSFIALFVINVIVTAVGFEVHP